MRPNNYTALNGLSAATVQNSLAIDGSQLYACSVQGILAGGGSNVGTLKIQSSDDPPYLCTVGTSGNLIPTNWNDIASASVTFSGNGSMTIPKTDLCYQWIRIVYTQTSGTGVNTITANVKTIAF